MLEILREILMPARGGGGAGCRVRIKPSWSGRVYGTYNIHGRHFLLAAVFVLSASALFGRLAALNLAHASVAEELAAIRLNTAHQHAMRLVAYPARTGQLDGRTAKLDQEARQIERILGLRQSDAIGGLGGMDEEFQISNTQLSRIDTETSYLRARYERLQSEFQSRHTELRHTPSIVPIVDAEFIPTSPFGRRISPFTRLAEHHRGIDLAADMFTKLAATADGTVVFVQDDPTRNGMGRYLIIDHGDRFQSWYGHCSRILVQVGDVVSRHQVVAEVGSTGRSTGPHVHYEVRRDGKALDPNDFMLLDPRFAELRMD